MCLTFFLNFRRCGSGSGSGLTVIACHCKLGTVLLVYQMKSECVTNSAWVQKIKGIIVFGTGKKSNRVTSLRGKKVTELQSYRVTGQLSQESWLHSYRATGLRNKKIFPQKKLQSYRATDHNFFRRKKSKGLFTYYVSQIWGFQTPPRQ